MAQAQPKEDPVEARIAGLARPSTVGWLDAAREAALGRLRAMGLPGPRDEYWRFTPPASLTATDAPVAAVFDPGDEAPVYGEIDRLKIVFVDGEFDAAQSDPLELAGLEITRLSEVRADLHWARDLYGALEAAGTGSGRPAPGCAQFGLCRRWCGDPGDRQARQAGEPDLPP